MSRVGGDGLEAKPPHLQGATSKFLLSIYDFMFVLLISCQPLTSSCLFSTIAWLPLTYLSLPVFGIHFLSAFYHFLLAF